MGLQSAKMESRKSKKIVIVGIRYLVLGINIAAIQSNRVSIIVLAFVLFFYDILNAAEVEF